MLYDRTKHQTVAQVLIIALGIAVAIALWPYWTGLLGGPILYVIFDPVYRLLHRWLSARVAAALTVVFAVTAFILPGLALAGLVVGEASGVARDFGSGAYVERLSRVRIGGFEAGPTLVDLGRQLVSWVGASALGIVGTAARLALNLTIAMFGLFYLLIGSGNVWNAVAPYVPFTDRNVQRLRTRFRNVTNSTLIGTGLTAVIQGLLLGLTFWAMGLPRSLFWGVVTTVFSILPVVGSGLIWGPAAIYLALTERYGMAVALVAIGAVVIGSVDNVIRPLVYNRWAQIHPIVTLVGALAGIRFFGLVGLLIGPLALSYFFELIAIYREEHFPTPPQPSPSPRDEPVAAEATPPDPA